MFKILVFWVFQMDIVVSSFGSILSHDLGTYTVSAIEQGQKTKDKRRGMIVGLVA